MNKNNKKMVKEIANGIKQCQITSKPRYVPSGKTILSDTIKPELLSKWPKLKLKVPPIFLHKPVNFSQHVKKVINMGIDFYQPHLGKNYTKVICQSFNDHKRFIQYLDNKHLPYHTFGNPSKRKMKVVIKGLPNDIDLITIEEELKSVSIPVIRVHKMDIGAERKNNKILILVVVPYDDEGKAVLKLTQLLGHNVKLEPPVNKPKQCHRCQKWGHTQRYCHGQLKCVKCGGDHLTKKCEKQPNVDPKCANCSDTHTASYKQCLFAPGSEDYKMMQAIKISSPCYKLQEIVTLANYKTLYRNVNY